MELNLQVHDIIKLNQPDLVLNKIQSLPDWVSISLHETPFVVVRRGTQTKHSIPVGVRGNKRNERYALNISLEDCGQIIKPDSIINKIFEDNNLLDKNLRSSLITLNNSLTRESLDWGIGGSIGFTLSSEKKVHNISSDIDIIIKTNESLSKLWAKSLLQDIETNIDRKVDIQVLTQKGSFNLKEFSIYDEVLLKTDTSEKIIISNQIWTL